MIKSIVINPNYKVKYSEIKEAKVGIFGGSFDPPHSAHLEVAEIACEKMALDKIIFVPARQNPLKVNSVVAGNQQRISMLEILLDQSIESKKFFISDIELLRKEDSYTYLTVNEIEEKILEAKLFLILGLDCIVNEINPKNSLMNWYRFQDLLKLCELVVARRDQQTFPTLEDLNKFGYSKEQVSLIYANRFDYSSDVSSRVIRGKFKGREPLDKSELPTKLLRYIKAEGIYSALASSES